MDEKRIEAIIADWKYAIEAELAEWLAEGMGECDHWDYYRQVASETYRSIPQFDRGWDEFDHWLEVLEASYREELPSYYFS